MYKYMHAYTLVLYLVCFVRRSNLTPEKVLERWKEAPPLPAEKVFEKVFNCRVGDKLVAIWTGNTACREDVRWLQEHQIGAIYQCRPLRVGCLQRPPSVAMEVKTIALVNNSDKDCTLDNMFTPAELFRAKSPALLDAMRWMWEKVKTDGINLLLHSTSGLNRAVAISLAFQLLVNGSSPVVPDHLEEAYKLALTSLIAKKEDFRLAFKEASKAGASASGSKQPAQQIHTAQSKRKQPASKEGEQLRRCPKGHGLSKEQYHHETRLRCDGECGTAMEQDAWLWSCAKCDFDLCKTCAHLTKEPAQVLPPSANTAGASGSKQPAMQGKRKQPASSKEGEPPPKAARHEDPFARLGGSALDRESANRWRASAEALVPTEAAGEAGGSAAVGGLPAFTHGVKLQTIQELDQRSQLNSVAYYITWKAVGTRCALFVCDGKAFLFSAAHVRQLATPPTWGAGCSVQQLLVHGELVEEARRMVFYAYELLHLRGSLPRVGQCSIMPDKPFNERLKVLELYLMPGAEHQLIAGELVLKAKIHRKLKYAGEPEFYDPASSQRIFSCDRNGLILLPVRSRFERGTNKEVFHWGGSDADLTAWTQRATEAHRLPEQNTEKKSQPVSRGMSPVRPAPGGLFGS